MENEGLERLTLLLPPAVRDALARVPPTVQRQTQEIRLRLNMPLTLSMPSGEWKTPALICTGEQLYTAFERLCEYSVHSHQEELRKGYIRLKNGCRAGIAGTAVVENGRVVSVRDITSICLRVARRHENCAKDLAFTLSKGGRLHAALLCGEPGSGKTSLLRDLVRCLAVGEATRPFRMAVVDERGELQTVGLPCDTLIGCPKAAGIEQALRNLAPEGIVFDELGDRAETAAVLRCLNSGVAAFATLHADGITALRCRPVARQALQSGAFEYVVLLTGRQEPGRISRVVPIEELAL